MRKFNFALLGVVVLGLGVAIVPSLGFAETSSSTTQALLDHVSALLRQMQGLQEQIDTLKGEQKEVKTELKTTVKELTKQINPGDKGNDVAIIQALLAADPEIYPEGLITGHFGSLTKGAVKRLQARHGLETPGRIGPKTLKVLNDLFKKNPIAFEDNDDNDNNEHNDRHEHGSASSSRGLAIGKSNHLCAMVPPGHLIAPGWLKKHDGVRPIVPECQVLPPGILKKLNGTSTPPTPTSTPDTTAPVISSVSATSTASTTATVSWTTNEAASSKVSYGTITPLSLTATSTLMVSNASMVTSHSLGLTGLTASTTTYYYVVESTDAASNKATSTEAMFVML